MKQAMRLMADYFSRLAVEQFRTFVVDETDIALAIEADHPLAGGFENG
jgi:hypothetical protein